MQKKKTSLPSPRQKPPAFRRQKRQPSRNLSFLYFLAAEVLHYYFKNLHSLSCVGNFLIN